MKYQPTHESKELTLFIENEYNLYLQIKQVIANLQKKYRKGTFDKEKAVKAFYNIANNGAKAYTQKFGNWQDKYYNLFDTSARYTTACDLLENYIEEIAEG